MLVTSENASAGSPFTRVAGQPSAACDPHLSNWPGSCPGRARLLPRRVRRSRPAKRVIYDGFKAALAAGVPKDKARNPGGRAVWQRNPTRCREERLSNRAHGGEEWPGGVDFEYSEEFARHIEAFNPTFAKVLVRYNPEGDTALNQRQANHLSRLMLTGGICENLLPIRARICAGPVGLASI